MYPYTINDLCRYRNTLIPETIIKIIIQYLPNRREPLIKRKFYIQQRSAKTGEGIYDGLEWLHNNIGYENETNQCVI